MRAPEQRAELPALVRGQRRALQAATQSPPTPRVSVSLGSRDASSQVPRSSSTRSSPLAAPPRPPRRPSAWCPGCWRWAGREGPGKGRPCPPPACRPTRRPLLLPASRPRRGAAPAPGAAAAGPRRRPAVAAARRTRRAAAAAAVVAAAARATAGQAGQVRGRLSAPRTTAQSCWCGHRRRRDPR